MIECMDRNLLQIFVSNLFASMIQYESFGDNMVVGQRDAKISEDGKDSLFGHEDRQPRQGRNGLDVRCKTRLHQKNMKIFRFNKIMKP